MTDVAGLSTVDILLDEWPGADGAPPFDSVEANAFPPALRQAAANHLAEVAAITGDPSPPDFANTLVPLERSGAMLSRVRRIFWTLSSAQADDGIRAIEGEVSELLARHGTAIGHDARLFARVRQVRDGMADADLNDEQRRLVEITYQGFVLGGAALEGQPKQRFAELDERLAALSVQFGQNVLAATNAWTMLLAGDELAGLPPSLCEAAARRGATAGHADACLFTLDRTDYEAFLRFSEHRPLRERMWRAFNARCDGGPHDNGQLIGEILALRRERAGLLGFTSHAAYALDDSMAAKPEAARALLMRVWAPARLQALAEARNIEAEIAAEGANHPLEPWDWPFYAERLRRRRYRLDAEAVRTKLTLGKVRDAAFAAAGRLYGLRFSPAPELPVYHRDVQAWRVADGDDAAGLLYTDYLARAEKHGGAWMGSLRVQERLDGAVRPIVYTVANFAQGAVAEESSLSLDEARTLFHEFGHALHALLSDVTYPSLAGTAVARDFVEFPSKFMEHWVVAPEMLRAFGLDDATVAAIGQAERFGQGRATIEYLMSALVDLAVHDGTAGAEWRDVEREVLAEIGALPQIGMRHRLPSFTHIFDGGYAGAYYSYMWSEVLDEDAFRGFAEPSRLYDQDLAGRFRREILAVGNARDPRLSFAAFKGAEPDEAPLLRARGLR